ncbi:acetyl-CoA carboxylase biotin carboxyl carrier protein subunit [Winogradskyella sp. MH6]|jgi:biotin carboxyl carrier protein|uniref:acetyl-CoA carboxylase biotin carboxyl carrier protein subunit n=1 Tax=Winogradskyella sp. MH6 TaxID=2929510 RepID=UPI000C9250E7|nr:acetyl-CoA carboxylase biotin carboxyl carrier protein subunit [Winogradskyella sp. MH6]MAB48953.1 acetyl-CoA carboxylase biotin carboxyl carrier protein subunit [Flavobacteriaceae bacterium]|tara:strand:+ start:30 stop:506 length:477 start_codon:yes stop_codon:yes gene_type:complete
MYKAKVNASYEFDINQEAVDQLDAVETSTNKYHILQNNSSIKANIVSSNFNKKTYSVKVNNNTYDVVINDALDQQIAALGFEIGASKKVDDIKAPMPGLILEINVKEAQEVKEDDPILILEAMKMENVINSPRDGVIKSIKVNQGDTVEKNALLIEFE